MLSIVAVNFKILKSEKYNLGDLVAIKRTKQGPGKKLKPNFERPYKINISRVTILTMLIKLHLPKNQ